MRLFYALSFDEQTKHTLSQIQNVIQPTLSKGRRTDASNLHLTLAFLGEQPNEVVPVLSKILEELPSFPIELRFSQLGQFKKHDGDIIWLGCDDNPLLLHLQRKLVKLIQESGIAFQDNRFISHVTLYRSARCTTLSEIKPFDARCRSVSLMLSHQVNGKPTYTRIADKYFQEL